MVGRNTTKCERLFHYNGLLCPNEAARAMRLDSRQQQELVELLLIMHSACVASLKYNWQPAAEATLPAVWSGYAAHERPDYHDSEALRYTAAKRLNIPTIGSASMVKKCLQEYLHLLWQELWLAPEHSANDTGLWLIEARYCETPPTPLLRYEDFEHLLGMRLTNPWWLHPEYDVENEDHQKHLLQLIPAPCARLSRIRTGVKRRKHNVSHCLPAGPRGFKSWLHTRSPSAWRLKNETS